MNSEPVETVASRAADLLNRAVTELRIAPHPSAQHRFYQLKTQAALFNFEVACDVVTLLNVASHSFSRKVILKNLIHRVFEYDKTLRQSHFKAIAALAGERGLSKRHQQVQVFASTWTAQMSSISKYSKLRNKASGHYDRDVSLLVSLIENIDPDETLDLVKRFLALNVEYLQHLSSIAKVCDA